MLQSTPTVMLSESEASAFQQPTQRRFFG